MVEENQPLGQVLVNPDRLQPPCSYHCHFSGGRLGGFLNWATTRACFIAQSKHHGAEERGVVSWFLGFSYLSAYARQPARGPTMLAHLVARLAYVGLSCGQFAQLGAMLAQLGAMLAYLEGYVGRS